ncbi:MAG: putative metal-binding motif-containing protein [Myxococcota bacterium]
MNNSRPRPSLPVLLLLCGCSGGLAVPVPRVSVASSTVQLEPIQFGVDTQTVFTLTNTGTERTRVVLQTAEPVFTISSIELSAGSSAEAQITLRPTSFEPIEQDIVLLWAGQRTVVSVEALVSDDWDQDLAIDARAGGTDCDDTEPSVNPAAVEVCDGLDNDCDDQVDNNATDASTWFADADGDGFGDPNASVIACVSPVGHVADNTDCDDAKRSVFPNAREQSDGIDQDCDGTIDEHLLTAGSVLITEIHPGDGASIPAYVELAERNTPSTLYLQNLRVQVADVSIVLSGGQITPGGSPVLLCGTDTPGRVEDVDCVDVLPNHEVEGTEVSILAEAELDAVQTSDFDFEDAASVELSPAAIRSGDNDSPDDWCVSTRVIGFGFGSPGSLDTHCDGR